MKRRNFINSILAGVASLAGYSASTQVPKAAAPERQEDITAVGRKGYIVCGRVVDLPSLFGGVVIRTFDNQLIDCETPFHKPPVGKLAGAMSDWRGRHFIFSAEC